MTHLDEGQLLALRDDPALAPDGTLGHVEACAVCRGALADIRLQARAVARALDALDTNGWNFDGARERVRLRVSAHAGAAADAPSLPGRRTRGAAWTLSRAAGLILVAAAGLSALPGSPVRSWIEQAMSPAAVEQAPAAVEAEPVVEPAVAEAAGIRLPLAGGPLSVVLRGAAPGTEIRVTWIPGSEAAVFAPVGSRFTSGEGKMEALLVSGPVRVELPRSVLPVSLEVNGRIYIRNTAEGLNVSGPVEVREDAGITFRLPPS